MSIFASQSEKTSIKHLEKRQNHQYRKGFWEGAIGGVVLFFLGVGAAHLRKLKK